MRKWKKGCAGLLTAAMAIGMIAPGAAVTADAENTVVDALTPKWQYSFEDTLNEENGAAVATAKTFQLAENYEGDVQYSAGKNGKAIYLDGNYGLDLNLPNEGRNNNYTISLWVNPVEDTYWASSVLIYGEHGTAGNNWVSLAQNGIWANVNGNNNSMQSYTRVLNEWQQYTLSVSGNTASLYRNGELECTQTVSETAFTAENSTVCLGVNAWDPNAKCYIDEVKIYNEALDAAQAKLLYKGVEVTADTQEVRVGKSITLNSVTLGEYDDCTVEWLSENESVAMVENGVVTGRGKGTVTITANLIREGQSVASDNIAINVLQETGQLIADFTFDDDETGFSGAGAIAEKNGDISIADRDGANGKALVLNGAGAWLNVVGENDASLLTGLEEFTVSYDSYSEGSWSFFAAPNADKQEFNEEHYIGLLDNTNNKLRAERYLAGRTEPVSATVEVNAPTGWKHVDLVQREGSIELYIDKVKVASKDVTSTVSGILGDNSIVQIGKGNWGNNGEYFKGMLDNYKIYNYALTAEEVASEPIDTMIITSDTQQVKLGNTLQLNVNISPEAVIYENLTWASSNTAVATVDQNGLVTPIAEGTATISVSAQDKEGVKSAEIEITVLPQTYTVTVNGGTIENPKAEYSYLERVTVTAPATTENGNFVGWKNVKGEYVSYARTYSFPVISNTELTADYQAEEPEKEVIVGCTAIYDASVGKMVFTTNRVVPVAACADSKVKGHGIVLTCNAGVGADKAQFVIGTTGVTNSAAKSTFGLLGTYNVRVKGTSGKTYYARGYVTYTDAVTKQDVTVYSDIVNIVRP